MHSKSYFPKRKIRLFYLLFSWLISFLFLPYNLLCATSIDLVSYPHFYDNPCLDEKMRNLIAPYLLPIHHPTRPKLDAIFYYVRAIENDRSLLEAGFTDIVHMPYSLVTIGKHPQLPGFIFKFYLDSETRFKNGVPHWERLVRRCKGAEKIKRLIKEHDIRYFVVPDKWLYILPPDQSSYYSQKNVVILIETDMEIRKEKKCLDAWKNNITQRHLDELFIILKNGCSSTALYKNIPFTKNGKFACIDTEHSNRKHDLYKVAKYLSPPMQGYWNYLILKDK